MFSWQALADAADPFGGLLLLLAAAVVLFVLSNDDDLPGPRRYFVRKLAYSAAR